MQFSNFLSAFFDIIKSLPKYIFFLARNERKIASKEIVVDFFFFLSIQNLESQLPITNDYDPNVDAFIILCDNKHKTKLFDSSNRD